MSRFGLQKVVSPPGGRYALIIVDSSGRPVSPLTEWYRLRKQPGPDGTRRTYLGFLLPFFGYLLTREYAWNSDPESPSGKPVVLLLPLASLRAGDLPG